MKGSGVQLNVALCVLVAAVWLRPAAGLPKEMTVHIEAGQTSCFFEGAKANQVIDIEYQVIDGGHGDLDISFSLHSPEGVRMVEEYKKPDNIHRMTANSGGDHKFCFDNSFSMFNRKTVFFEIIVESEDDSEDGWGKDFLGSLMPDNTFTDKVCSVEMASFQSF